MFAELYLLESTLGPDDDPVKNVQIRTASSSSQYVLAVIFQPKTCGGYEGPGWLQEKNTSAMIMYKIEAAYCDPADQVTEFLFPLPEGVEEGEKASSLGTKEETTRRTRGKAGSCRHFPPSRPIQILGRCSGTGIELKSGAVRSVAGLRS